MSTAHVTLLCVIKTTTTYEFVYEKLTGRYIPQDITGQDGSLLSKTLARRTDSPMLRRVRHQAAPIAHNVVVVSPPFNRTLQTSIFPCAASCGFAVGARFMSGAVANPVRAARNNLRRAATL